MTKHYALLSVSDKTGILEIAKGLLASGLTLLSTGGTYKALVEAGIDATKVEDFTGFPEMMDGRVKTLHPKIHGGILARRDLASHRQAINEHDLAYIDVVVVNLYPFKETIQQDGVSLEEAIEQIDIGGPTILRAAAKNYRDVTVLTDPQDYKEAIRQFKEDGATSLAFRAYLAKKVFAQTSHYDGLIHDHLAKALEGFGDFEEFHSKDLTLTYEFEQEMRYGENSQQAASLYKIENSPIIGIPQAKQLHGKALSYNNLKDADAAIRLISEFEETCAVALKHMNPCGVGIGKDINQAFDRCHRADPVSIFGGILAFNRPVEKTLAEKIHRIFIEMVIAPEFTPEALEILKKKKNIRLLTLPLPVKALDQDKEYVSILGGLLAQSRDTVRDLPEDYQVMTELAPSEDQIKALHFANRVAKHVKSNAIVIANAHMTLGIGAGQMNRVGAAKIALDQSQEKEEEDRAHMVMASDAFFPMDDTVRLAAQYGVEAIVQPGGSIRDKDSVLACNELGIPMVKNGYRHFRH
ncbi:bifunctional phosphoribosylaminoimidazolecarboxamide formyltransferase/IMP cyclohydrolase PurH [Atopobacter sp. AH10]|uniref:bifunctional phosphoribosylaminoimidazolecarboxamide formyltransferase/IMP cyclohydrolase n=1 Tax=Atopobacter sp. AH10 TaxID=2315861 RepID=UPI000EF246E0|nr:bifunctional phosphoribosylaminoimidazolecarboxamide formyltransferase/IMP cyclohydrolase [Atopobacter sp. AH10]RLK64002.1 bifunctional phosphoribosylaminoimidazolecarboxamide formyltransferase/IMP cyclohydrolase PurH [Atopobacter sp. AH10]